MSINSIKLEHQIIKAWINSGASGRDLGCGDGALLTQLVNEKTRPRASIELNDKAIQKCLLRA
jgi:hypothetical protein